MLAVVKGLLLDLDGVLYNAEEIIEGAAESVAWVRDQRIPFRFVTNTTSRPRSALVEKLGRLGISATAGEFLTPPAVAAAWLRNRPGTVALFVSEATMTEFEGVPLADERADYVVVGDIRRDYDTLNRAFRYLHHNDDAQLLALGMTRYWKAADGISLDVGPFVVALEHAADRNAVVLGKPAPEFFRAALGQLGVPEAVMVGDDIRGDVGGAQAAGLAGVLVRTGKFRPEDLAGEVTPDAVLDSIADLPSWWTNAS